MQGIIDRFEGEFAIIELEGKLLNINRDILPAEVREGYVIIFRNNKWEIDAEATAKLQLEMEKMAKQLWEDVWEP